MDLRTTGRTRTAMIAASRCAQQAMADGGRNAHPAPAQLASVPFGAGVVPPVLFRVEWLEPAALLFRELVAVLLRALPVVLADPVVVRLAAVVCEVVRPGALFAAVAAAAAFGAGLSTALGAAFSAGFGVVLAAALGAAFSAGFGVVFATALGAGLTAGVFGAVSATALCHAFLLGTSGELWPPHSGAVTATRSSANFRWLASSCSARW